MPTAHNYHRIETAIAYLRANFRRQPQLDEVAAAVHLSPLHFQRLFTEWAGTSPKKFTRFLTLAYAKEQLRKRQATLFDTTLDAGLSSTSRLHDLFVSLEGMTPAEYRDGGRSLTLHYATADTPFGPAFLAATARGLCSLRFQDTPLTGLHELRREFPAATLREAPSPHHTAALAFFRRDWTDLPALKLHLRGTDFQFQVWRSLLTTPSGHLTTYGTLAEKIGKPGASRAVGTAVGSNPVAFLIPCHRVIQSSGALGGYRWGLDRKAGMIGWEAVGHP